MKKIDISLYYKESLPSIKILPLLIGLVLLGGCWQPLDMQIGDSGDWDAGNGMVNVRIALNDEERFVLPTDKPTKDYVDYYEAVLREQGTTHYYIGTALAGESYIRVSVPPGKTYDVLVLAGTPANGQAANGMKVLLASGWVPDYTVISGQNRIAVPMKLHATEDCFTATHNPSGTTHIITYIPVISNMQGLLKAAGTKRNDQVFAGAEASIVPYPDPYSDNHRFPLVTAITTDAFMGTLHFTITDAMPPKAVQEDIYYCYYNIGYYAFSDPGSRSSRWDIRRGVVNDMYTASGYYGGGVPLRYEQTYYYVSASGDDAGPGTRNQPFKTIARAVRAARTTPPAAAPWIQTVVVLGTLDNTSEQAGNAAAVFVIQNPQAGEYPVGLIRITGDPALTGGGAAILSGANTSNKRILYITGDKTNVQLDHITITDYTIGGSVQAQGGGILLTNKSLLTITEGAKIADIKRFSHEDASTFNGGVGVRVENGAKLIMYGGEITNNNGTDRDGSATGGGVLVTGGGYFKMYDGSISKNQSKWGGGVAISNNSTFSMFGGSISENQVSTQNGLTGRGAGVLVYSGCTFVMSGGKIIKNKHSGGTTSASGGGGVFVEGEFRMSGTALIGGTSADGNSSVFGGGGVIVKNNGKFYLDTREGAAITGNTSSNGANVRKENGGFFELNGVSQSAGAFNNSIP
jgi:hypothetical protein